MEKALRHAGLFLFAYFVYVLAIAEISAYNCNAAVFPVKM